MFITPAIVQTAFEVGLIYSLVALSLYLSFTILDLCDLSTDGCYTLGCAVAAMITIAGHPVLALFAAMAAGVCSGFITATLQTRLGVESILAGIIVNTGLYTINLFVMGMSSNVSIFKRDTVFSLFRGIAPESAFWKSWSELILIGMIVVVMCVAMYLFLGTRLGLSIRATGDNDAMVKSSSINPAFMITVGLCVSNACTGLAGGLIGQYNKSCDINLGTGMVTVALASLVIGETLLGKGSVKKGIIGVIIGSCLYRFIVALALRMNVPTEAFKLVSAVIVAVAIATPKIKEIIRLRKIKAQAMAEHKAENARLRGGNKDA